MKTSPRCFRRGDVSPEHPGLFFWCYGKEREVWVSPEKYKDDKAKSLLRVAKHAAKKKAKWQASDAPRVFKRGDVSELHPGLVFWSLVHYGTEWWVTPEKFEYLRLKKNADAIGYVPSLASQEKEKLAAKIRSRRPEVRAKTLARQRAKQPVNTVRYREKRRAYKKMRRATDPIFRLKATIGTRIRCGLKYQAVRKRAKTIDMIGCSYEYFRFWITLQFEPGMSLDNYGFHGWHIDHIIPVSLFDLSDPIVARHAFSFRNCRPSWKPENMSKNDTLDMALVAKHELWEWLPYVTEPLLAAA